MLARSKYVRKSPRDIVALLDFCISESQRFIELMTVVAYVAYESPELIPSVVTEGTEISDNTLSTLGFFLFGELLKSLIHQALNIVLVGGPQLCFLVPNCIERTSSNHQIFRSTDSEIGEDFQGSLVLTLLNLSRPDLKEIHITSSRSSGVRGRRHSSGTRSRFFADPRVAVVGGIYHPRHCHYMFAK